MIRYNDWEFSPAASLLITNEFISDDADTITTCHKLMITVKDFVVPSSTCGIIEDEMEDIKSRLGRKGMALILGNVGYGTSLIVNDPGETGSTWDIKAGPKPRVVSWEPIGNTASAHITWQCEVNLSPCLSNFEGVSEFNYSIIHSLNDRGYTTATKSGYLRIAQSSIEGVQDPFAQSKLSDTADRYRDEITNKFNKPINYKREQSFHLSSDFSRVDFVITDREIESPNAYPEGVVSISAPTRSRFRLPQAGESANTTISVNLELAADQPRVRAWEIFDAIVTERTKRFSGSILESRIVRDLEVSEDYFSHRYSFTMVMTSVAPLFAHMSAIGYFSPIPLNWIDWDNSMATVKANRGFANRHHIADGANPQLFNLCDADGLEEPAGYAIQEPPDKTIYKLCSEAPNPEESWFDQDAMLIECPEIESTYQTTYGRADVVQKEFDPSNSDYGNGTLIGVENPDYEVHYSDSPPVQRFIWKGRIKRIGYPIAPIGKTMIGDKVAKVVGTPYFTSRLIGYMFCLPVYEAVWNVGLVVVETPTLDIKESDPTNSAREDAG